MKKIFLALSIGLFILPYTAFAAASISLNGGNTMTVLQTRTWSEPGGVVFGVESGAGDWSNVTITGTVDTNAAVGTSFTLNYQYTHPTDPSITASKQRTVTIAPAPGANQKPIISAQSPQTTPFGEASISATCTDAEDGGVIPNITYSQTIDATTPAGTYSVILNCADSQNLLANPITVTVIVDENYYPSDPDDEDPDEESPSKKTGIVPCDGATGEVCEACHIVQLGQNILTWFISIMAVVIALVFVIGGLKMVMAGGNEGQVTSAKSMMTNAIIGFIILLASWLIVDTVIKTFVRGADTAEKSDDFLLGPWNEIKCEGQPGLIERPIEEDDASVRSANWDTEVSTNTTLQKLSMSDPDLWNTELKIDRPNYSNTNWVWNYDSSGTSIPLIVPENIDQNYGLSITTFLYYGIGIDAVISTERDFGGEILARLQDRRTPDAPSLGYIFTPADAGKVVYFNYRAVTNPEYPWSLRLHMSFRKTDKGPGVRTYPPIPETPSTPDYEY